MLVEKRPMDADPVYPVPSWIAAHPGEEEVLSGAVLRESSGSRFDLLMPEGIPRCGMGRSKPAPLRFTRPAMAAGADLRT